MIEQILVYKVVGEIQLKHLYFVCHIGGYNLPYYIYIGYNVLPLYREQLLGGSLCGAQIP